MNWVDVESLNFLLNKRLVKATDFSPLILSELVDT